MLYFAAAMLSPLKAIMATATPVRHARENTERFDLEILFMFATLAVMWKCADEPVPIDAAPATYNAGLIGQVRLMRDAVSLMLNLLKNEFFYHQYNQELSGR